MFVVSSPSSSPSSSVSALSASALSAWVLRFSFFTFLVVTGWTATSGPVSGVEIPFSDAQAFGAAARLVSWADMDGDGDPDLLGEVGTDLVWLENGAFWSSHTVGAVATAGSVQAVDVDGDGDLDVLAASTAPAETAWWENTAGNGGTWTKHVVGAGSRAVGGDFDRDGDVDIGALVGSLVWLENTAGDGSAWSSHTVDGAATASELSAHDVDGDGDVDLVGWGDAIHWWQNNADGATWTRRDVELGIDAAESVALADVDGDGDADVLASTFVDGGGATDHRLGWWENTAGDGTAWTEHHEDAGAAVSHLDAADLDGDGDVDFVRASELGAVDWWENLGTGWSSYNIDTTAGDLGRPLIGDPDRDGDLDVTTLGSGAGAVLFENRTLHRKAHYPTLVPIDDAFAAAQAVAAGDFDGDGDLDVAAGSSGGLLSWWENTAGDASSWSEHTVDTDIYEARRLAVADLDGDGDLDLAAGSASAGGLRWWRNNGDGSVWTEGLISETFADAVDLLAADMDGDGDLDVLAASFGSGLSWWENAPPLPRRPKADGDGTTWIEHTVVGGFFYALSVDAADMDGDGDLDVLGPDYVGDAVYWWESSAGNGSAWTRHDVVTGVDAPTEVRAADFDGDGHVDVVGSFESAGVRRWRNDGSGGGWAERLVSLSSAQDLDVMDLDGDGDLDVLGPQTLGGGRLVWWRNGDDGLNWFTQIATTGFAGGASALAADLDGDGDPDLVATASTAGAVAWWPNLGGQAELTASNAALGGSVRPGAEAVPLLTVDLRHHGRFGDDELELAELVLHFESTAGNALTDAAMNALIEAVHVHRGGELLHTETGPFVLGAAGLGAGDLRLALTDGAALAALAFEADDIGYAAAQFSVAADIASFTSPPGAALSTFRVGLVLEDPARRSTVEMRATDLPAGLVPAQDGYSSLVSVRTEADIAVSLMDLRFGRHAVDAGPSPILDLVITNEGSAALTEITVEIDGGDAADFAVAADTGETSLTPGQSRTVSLTFDPSTVGTKLSELLVLSSDPDSGFLVLDLDGVGIDPEISVGPSSLDFGEVELGVPSAYRAITVTNDGTTNMEILGLEAVGADAAAFEILDASLGFVGVGASRIVEVRFTPDAERVFGAQLRILSDDGDEAVVTVELGGTGFDPLSVVFIDGFESGDLSAWTVP